LQEQQLVQQRQRQRGQQLVQQRQQQRVRLMPYSSAKRVSSIQLPGDNWLLKIRSRSRSATSS
jgi:hypothetical protein